MVGLGDLEPERRWRSDGCRKGGEAGNDEERGEVRLREAVWLIGGPDLTPEPIPAGMMGVGGTTTYRFRAVTPGTQTLEFAYLPSWDKGVAPTRTARYDVTVKSAGWQNWF